MGLMQARDDLLPALDEAMAALHLAYARLDGSTLSKEEDCTWYTTRIGFSVYGAVLLQEFSASSADRRIVEVETALQESGRPHHWFVTPTGRPSDLGARLEAAGASKVVVLNGMAMNLADLAPEPELPNGVEIRPALDEDAVRDYARIYPLLFDVPLDDWGDALVEAELELFSRAGDTFHRYVAYRDGMPIAAGMTVGKGEAAVLETLCTLPELRGQGIGRVVATRALRAEAERGCTTGLVWSGPGADRLYARMGFDYVCTGDIYLFPDGWQVAPHT